MYLFPMQLFLAVLGLCCCRGFSLAVVSGGYSSLQTTGSRAQTLKLGCTGLVAPRHVGSSQTRDQICLLHWQADSLPATGEAFMYLFIYF